MDKEPKLDQPKETRSRHKTVTAKVPQIEFPFHLIQKNAELSSTAHLMHPHKDNSVDNDVWIGLWLDSVFIYKQQEPNRNADEVIILSSVAPKDVAPPSRKYPLSQNFPFAFTLPIKTKKCYLLFTDEGIRGKWIEALRSRILKATTQKKLVSSSFDTNMKKLTQIVPREVVNEMYKIKDVPKGDMEKRWWRNMTNFYVKHKELHNILEAARAMAKYRVFELADYLEWFVKPNEEDLDPMKSLQAQLESIELSVFKKWDKMFTNNKEYLEACQKGTIEEEEKKRLIANCKEYLQRLEDMKKYCQTVHQRASPQIENYKKIWTEILKKISNLKSQRGRKKILESKIENTTAPQQQKKKKDNSKTKASAPDENLETDAKSDATSKSGEEGRAKSDIKPQKNKSKSSSDDIETNVTSVLQNLSLRFTNNKNEILLACAHEYLCHGKYDFAITYLKKVLDDEPNNFISLFSLATALSQKGQYEEALQYFQIAKLLNIDSKELINNYALTLAKAGKIEEAKEAYENLLIKHENYPHGLLNFGVLYHTSKQVDVAEEYFNRAFILDSHNPVILNNKGVIFGAKNKFSEALTYFNLSSQMDSDYKKSKVNKTMVEKVLLEHPELNVVEPEKKEQVKLEPQNVLLPNQNPQIADIIPSQFPNLFPDISSIPSQITQNNNQYSAQPSFFQNESFGEKVDQDDSDQSLELTSESEETNDYSMQNTFTPHNDNVSNVSNVSNSSAVLGGLDLIFSTQPASQSAHNTQNSLFDLLSASAPAKAKTELPSWLEDAFTSPVHNDHHVSLTSKSAEPVNHTKLFNDDDNFHSWGTSSTPAAKLAPETIQEVTQPVRNLLGDDDFNPWGAPSPAPAQTLNTDSTILKSFTEQNTVEKSDDFNLWGNSSLVNSTLENNFNPWG